MTCAVRKLRPAVHFPPELPNLRAAALAAARLFADGGDNQIELRAAGDALSAAVEGDAFDLMLATACIRCAGAADANQAHARAALRQFLGENS